MTSDRANTLAIAALTLASPIAAIVNPRETLWLWRHGNNPDYDRLYRGKKR